MVAGNDDDLALAAEASSDRPQDGFGGREGLDRTPLQELDRIAEQDQPLNLV